MDFGKVLTRSWQIIWRNRVLWVFGILASCASGGGGGGGSNFSTQSQTQTGTGDLPPELERIYVQVERFFETTPQETLIAWGVGIACFFILLGVFFWAVGTFGKLGLIRGAMLAEGGKSLTFSSLANESWRRLGGALWLNFLLGIPPLVIFGGLGLLGVGTAISAMAGDASPIGNMGALFICLVPIICIAVLLSIPYGIFIQLANVAYVGENLSSRDAISKGWQVFKANWGNGLILLLILGVGSFVVGLILSVPYLVVAAPALISLIANDGNGFGDGLLISAICFVLVLPVMILATGILQGYVQNVWTLAYAEMAGKKPVKRKTSTR